MCFITTIQPLLASGPTKRYIYPLVSAMFPFTGFLVYRLHQLILFTATSILYLLEFNYNNILTNCQGNNPFHPYLLLQYPWFYTQLLHFSESEFD